ncbi:hypothetical protein BSKO_11125 [Bryopsis sp. KO-2023]|nr:hypothetical protein BSKO_11125 [Bryopsis sp. KO-2023]
MLLELFESEEGLASKVLGCLDDDDLCRVAQLCTKLKGFTSDLRAKKKFIKSRTNTGSNLHPGGKAQVVCLEYPEMCPRPFGDRNWAGTVDIFVNFVANGTDGRSADLCDRLSGLKPADAVLLSMYRGTALWVAAWEYFPGELELLNGLTGGSCWGVGYWLTKEWRRRLDDYRDVCVRDVDTAVKAAGNLRLILIQSYIEYGYCLPMPAWSAMERFGLDAYYNHKKVGEELDLPPQQGTLYLIPRDFWQYHSHLIVVDPSSKTYEAVAASIPALKGPTESDAGVTAEVRNMPVLCFIHPDYVDHYGGSVAEVASDWEGKVPQEILDGLVWLTGFISPHF